MANKRYINSKDLVSAKHEDGKNRFPFKDMKLVRLRGEKAPQMLTSEAMLKAAHRLTDRVGAYHYENFMELRYGKVEEAMELKIKAADKPAK